MPRDEYEVWTYRKDGDLLRSSKVYLHLDGAIQGALSEAGSAPEGEHYEVEVKLFESGGGPPLVVFSAETRGDGFGGGLVDF